MRTFPYQKPCMGKIDLHVRLSSRQLQFAILVIACNSALFKIAILTLTISLGDKLPKLSALNSVLFLFK